MNITAQTVNKQALKQKYREEQDKRLRPDGNAQYVRIEGRLSHYLDDPYVPVQEHASRRPCCWIPTAREWSASRRKAGAAAYFEYTKAWRESGEFDGIEFCRSCR